MTTTDSSCDLIAALDRLTEAVAALAARLPAEPPGPDPTPVEPEIGSDAAPEPPVPMAADRRVVSMTPAAGWRSETSQVDDDGALIVSSVESCPLVAWAVCRDGRIRPVVADSEGRARVVEPGLTPGVFIAPSLDPVDEQQTPRARPPRRWEPHPYVTG
jgi:hypothetical protein